MSKVKHHLEFNSAQEKWDESYYSQFERNIGILSLEDQEKIKNSTVAILGTGGIGAPAALNLAYSGIENFILADFDKIEVSNLNRQPFTHNDIGKYKVDCLRSKIQQINPRAYIRSFREINKSNIAMILDGVDIVVLSLDGPVGSIHVARECKRRGISMVEGWATPFVFTRWYTQESMDYESVYGLSTQPYSIEEIRRSKSLQRKIKEGFMNFFLTLPEISQYYQNDMEKFKQMMNGEIGLRSFAPFVWAESIYLTHDVIFAGILEKKKKILAPLVRAFDYFSMRMIQ